MPRGNYPGYTRTSARSRPGPLGVPISQPDNRSLTTGVWRHEYNEVIEGANILTGEYAEVNLMRFRRSFSAGADDVPPTATQGNNYASPSVFNGSRLRNYNGVVNIASHESPDTGTTINKTFMLDIYEIQLSFNEGYLWNNLQPTNCPIDFDTDTVNHNAGEVEFKDPAIVFSSNFLKGSKFNQRFIKHVARIPSEPGKNYPLRIHGVPPKVMRANSGMFWGLIIHNDATLNDADNWNGHISYDVSFEEIPSENRLPWLY